MSTTEGAAGSPPDRPTVVGIGASAGGLAALKELFASFPEETGLVFVVVVHLSPEHESHLAELLQPSVPIPVEQVTQDVELTPDRVYVIPPNRNLAAVDSHLRLLPLEEQRRERAPIDHFFRTLAATHDGRSVAVVLTGTGSDGALGAREVKGRGGLTIAQDPSEAEYDGMPQSAIATGMIDLVLPLEQIPPAILRFDATEPRLPIGGQSDVEHDATRQTLYKVFAQLRARTGRDFTHYKRSTILRRIGRRMQLAHTVELGTYLARLREDPGEVRALADDLLITVTNFFRDADVFARLERDVIPQLFEGREANDVIRVWSVGCATGEEAYSLAMLLLEEAERRGFAPRIQVFASDLHEHSLDRAREGFYPGDIEVDVNEERLRRFFDALDGGYRIKKEVRELVVFAPHDLLRDPPFSRLDLVCCRNVLIYLKRAVQADVIAIFHYALLPSGFLVLGSSETLEDADLFTTSDKKNCLFRKRNVPVPDPRLPVFPAPAGRVPRLVPTTSDGEPMSYGVLHQRMVERYAPPSMLVSLDDKVVHLSEHAGRYLVHPGGELTSSVVRLIREELRIELRAALHTARQGPKAVRSQPIDVRFDDGTVPVVLHVRPAVEAAQEGFVLVFFDEHPASAAPPLPSPDSGSDIEALCTELDVTRQRLQATIEEYETSREEMRASNEELQSSNEELRSTMEELETSKEELQSMNEELQTVNQERRHKVEELALLSDDLQNLLTSTDIATLFLDRALRILRFTPKVAELFNVRAADRGRPITDFTHRLGYGELVADAEAVLRTLMPIEREIRDEAGRWYLTRVLPYRAADDRIAGTVITFVDITTRKHAEEELLESNHLVRESEHRFRALVDASAQMVWTTDPAGEVIDDAPSWCDFTGQREVDRRGAGWLTALHPEDRERAAAELRAAIETGRPWVSEVRIHHAADGTHRWTSLRAVPLETSNGPRGWVAMTVDITERRAAEEALRQSERRYRSLFEQTVVGVARLDAEGRIAFANQRLHELLGYDAGALLGTRLADVVEGDEPRRELAAIFSSREVEGGSVTLDGPLVRHDGGRLPAQMYVTPISDAAGAGGRAAVAVVLDVTDQRRAESALHEADRRKDDFLATLAHELRNPLAPLRTGLELLVEEVTAEEPARQLRIMDRQVRHLAHLIDDLLDVSRITRGKLRLRRRPMDLADVIRGSLEAARPLVAAAEHHLDLALPDSPLRVDGDPTRLAQVFTNLLTNAIRYTPAGGVVRVSASDDGDDVVVRVEDSGIGIHADMLDGVFTLFTQASDGLLAGQSGLGIGLSLSRSLLEMHGGALTARSDGLGHGSTFVVRLPRLPGDAEAASTEPPPPDLRASAPLRILVVDDNADAVELLAQVLARAGHTVATAGEGQRALEVGAGFGPDVVVMDLGMPRMDGYTAARRMRDEPWGRRATLVALTGWGQQADKRRAREAGFDHHLVKPADRETLARILFDVATARDRG